MQLLYFYPLAGLFVLGLVSAVVSVLYAVCDRACCDRRSVSTDIIFIGDPCYCGDGRCAGCDGGGCEACCSGGCAGGGGGGGDGSAGVMLVICAVIAILGLIAACFFIYYEVYAHLERLRRARLRRALGVHCAPADWG